MKLGGKCVELMRYMNKQVMDCYEQTGCKLCRDDYIDIIQSDEFKEKFADSCNIHSLGDLLNFYIGIGGMITNDR